MNYYKRHIGDYMKDASHLSLLEHGVYMRLLDVYYTRECAIPVDQAARLISARTKEEKAALEVVTCEFFTVVDGAYTQTRCDSEIAAMQHKTETNREVGKRGGRPKKETQKAAASADSGNPEKTQTVSENNPNHKPLTNNQEYPHTPSVAGGHVDQKKPSAVSLETWLDNIKSKGEQPIPPTDPVFAYAEEAGIPMEHMRLAWAEFRARYTEPGAKRYRDWRTVYRKAVRGNWFKLWFCTADGEYALTTTGTQALRTMQAKQAAREGVEA